jgi:multidrug efflux pump subunit AcrB
MTTMAALLGAVPLAIGTGEEAEEVHRPRCFSLVA